MPDEIVKQKLLPDRAARLSTEEIEERLETFFAYFEEFGDFRGAAASAGIPIQTAERYRAKHVEFRARMDAVAEEFKNKIRREAIRRGVEGYDRPIFQRGEQVGVERKYSDPLLIKLMEAHLPEMQKTYAHLEPGTPAGVLVVMPTAAAPAAWLRRYPGQHHDENEIVDVESEEIDQGED